jgi:gephyrin
MMMMMMMYYKSIDKNFIYFRWLERNTKVHFGRILMKPGKPLTFATLTHTDNRMKLIFATPGNPVSCMVTSILFVVPSMLKLSGYLNPFHTEVDVSLTHSIRLDPQRPEYHRANVKWNSELKCLTAQSTGIQESSRLLSMKSANALLILPRSAETLQPGACVKALLFGTLGY